MRQSRLPLRRPVWPLAASLQMLNRTALNIASDLTVNPRRIPDGEVVRPAFQVSIQLTNQNRNRLKTLVSIRHLVQLLPFPLDRLIRRKHIQVCSIASFQIAVVPERVSQKIQTSRARRRTWIMFSGSVTCVISVAGRLRIEPMDGYATPSTTCRTISATWSATKKIRHWRRSASR